MDQYLDDGPTWERGTWFVVFKTDGNSGWMMIPGDSRNACLGAYNELASHYADVYLCPVIDGPDDVTKVPILKTMESLKEVLAVRALTNPARESQLNVIRDILKSNTEEDK